MEVNSFESSIIEDALLEDQIDLLFSKLVTQYGLEIQEDESETDLCWRDRILTLKFGENPFEFFLSYVQEIRPPLHRALSHHPLVTAKYKTKRKQSGGLGLRNRFIRHDRKDSDSSSAAATRGSKRKFEVYDIGSGMKVSKEELFNVDKRAQLLGAMVAKSVTDGSLQSQLIAVSVLMHELITLEDRGLPIDSSECALPVGNVLAALFENSGSGSGSLDDASKSREADEVDDSGEGTYQLKLAQCNPFRSFLRSSHIDSAISLSGQHASSTSRGDGGSQSTYDDRHSELGSLYAPSNVGSLQADHGTETASVCDAMVESEEVAEASDEEVEDDDEELLAQALAMSMGNEIATAAGLSTAAIASANMPALSESSLSRLPDKRARFPSPTSQTDSYLPEKPFDASALKSLAASVHPMSTFGPFCNVDFWKSVASGGGEASNSHSLKCVSIQNTIISLLVNVSAGVDAAHSLSGPEESKSSAQESKSSGRGFRAMMQAQRSGSEVPCIIEAVASHGIPLARATPLALHPVTFLILEMLLDMFLTALTALPPSPTSSSSAANSLWQSKKNFLVYGLTVFLKILSTKFRIVEALGTRPTSVGLVQRSRSTSGADASSTPTIVDRLLKIVCECVGTDVLPSSVMAACGVDLPSGSQRWSIGNSGADASMHAIRMIGIDTLTAGFSVFFPDISHRKTILMALVQSTKVCITSDSNASLYMSYPAVFSSLGLVTDDPFGSKLFGDGDIDYCKNHLLQKVCVAMTADSLDWAAHVGSSSMSGGGSSASQSVSPRASVSSSSGAGAERERVFEHLRALLPSDVSTNSAVIERMVEAVMDYQDMGIPSPFAVPPVQSASSQIVERLEEESQSGDAEFLSDLEMSLVRRMASETTLKAHAAWSGESTAIALSSTLLWWGEMCLLFKLQQRHNYELSKVNTSDDEVSNVELEFDPKRCCSTLKIVGDGQSIAHTVGKTWATAAASKGFEPNTGEHVWAVKLDRCDKGHVFVGMIAQNAGLSTYVGADKYGWGLIGTRDLWHNRHKVKSKYGEGFTTKSVVYVKYDSDNNTISFSVGSKTNWEVAFADIPKVTIFPAVSLYQRDDRMTLVTVDTSIDVAIDSTADLSSSYDKSTGGHPSFARVAPSMAYALAIFDAVERILDNAEKCSDWAQQSVVLSHPFVTVLLPSLTAAIVAIKANSQVSAYVAIQLLPHLTMLTKRLSYLHDSRNADNLAVSECGFMGDISGDWQIDSAAAGNNIQAQKYFVSLETHPSGGSEGHHTSDRKYQSVKLSGHGRGNTTSVSIAGTVYGTRIRFLETWNMSGKCLIDCRLSLDGNSFSGKFKDMKSGSSGSLKASRVRWREPYGTSNVLIKNAMLTAMACGKLAAQLVVGIDPVASSDVFDAISAPDLPRLIGQDSDMSDSKEEDALADSKEDTDVLDVDPDAPTSCLSAQEALQRWMSSSLFSGGLKEDAEFIGAIGYQLQSYMTLVVPSTGNVDDDKGSLSTDAACLKTWWNEQVFGKLNHYCTYADDIPRESSAVSYRYICTANTVSPREEDLFFSQLQSAQGMGKRLDDHIVRHTGMSVVCKVGGDSMQAARRRVLASLLYHSGCVGLCYAEDKALANADRDESDKPHVILQDIWRAGQRIIEHVIRRRQEAGVSYGYLSQELLRKADFLMTIRPNAQSNDIAIALRSLDSLPMSPRLGHNEAAGCLTVEHVKAFVARNLSEMVEFFQSSSADVALLRVSFFKASLRAMSRTAGFRALLVLLGKSSTVKPVPADMSHRLPHLSSLYPQPFAVDYILPALFGMSDNSAGQEYNHSCATGGSDEEDGGDLSYSGVAASQVSIPMGHFTESLQVVGEEHLRELRAAFEGAYELITQLLQRCTWAGDRDGQCVALSAWDMSIIPADHTFLNRIGIFRLLQTVLDDTRASQALHADMSSDSGTDPYAREIILQADKRLTQLALKIVHTLASQVAYCKDGAANATPSLTLQRNPSGPETLSQALFDMLYSELFTCIKRIISDVYSRSRDPSPSATPCEKSEDRNVDLEGTNYAYRILRLLFSVSDSLVCQRYLSTPKWLTLLVSAIGFGDICVQRRLLRLLSRLLMSTTPDKLRVHSGELLTKNEDILLADAAFDEDDVEAMISGDEDGVHCAEKLLGLFLDASTVQLSIITGKDEEKIEALGALMEIEDGITNLSAECITILRMLEYMPDWRPVVVATLRRPLKCVKDVSGDAEESVWSNPDCLAKISGVMGVMGGHIDRLRVGGTVMLRPFSLASMTDSFAFRLACVSHSSAMLVSRLPSSNSAEVVLMERPHNSTHYSISSGSVPVRPVKISMDDIMPAQDISPSVDFFDADLIADCVNVVKQFCVPLVHEIISKRALKKTKQKGTKKKKSEPVQSGRFMGLEDPDDDEDVNNDDEDADDAEGEYERARTRLHNELMLDEDAMDDQLADSVGRGDGDDDSAQSINELEALQMRVCVASMRSLAEWMRCNGTISSLSDDDIGLYQNILNLAVTRVSVGGLSEIEAIETRWAALWQAYILLAHSKSTQAADSTQTPDSVQTDTSIPRSLRMRSESSSTTAPSGESATPSREGLVSSQILASLLAGPSAAEATRAREQMMEMGFPREWCDVALRRCRYNVELAINLCFEHGPEMNQIVAEEAALASAASSARAGGREPRDAALELVARLASRRAGADRREDAPREQNRGDNDRQQLLAMGFSPHLCRQALAANGNDVDASLAWILTRQRDPSEEDSGDEKEEVMHGEGKEDETTGFGPNPLGVISGVATIKEDLSVGGSTGGFPSVGCRGYHVTSGKWYYEVTIETSGCMQFGWADLCYEGGADQGEGVGDDSHSWAYDGWRKLKWNHVSSDWGAKWAPGDVIGCLIDMDNCIMSFTLNGFGSEIGMGLAYENFSCYGGLYPCVSFNKHEKLAFNFGYRAFRHPPPVGYHPYAEHVQVCLDSNILKLQALMTFKTKVGGACDPSGCMEGFGGAFFEDCLEEQRGETDFLSHRRYFHHEESSRGETIEQKARQAAMAIMSAPIPQQKNALLSEFETLSSDLCVLYSRLMVLRLASAFSRYSSTNFIVKLLSHTPAGTPSSNTNSVDKFIHIVRESSSCTLRTKIYLHTVAMISPASLPPPNLGSVLSTGGAPMLSSLQNAMVSMFEAFASLGNSTLTMCALEQIRIECMLATRREYSAEWKYEGGYAPVIYKDSSSSALKNDRNIPSLVLGSWLTVILIQHMLKEMTCLEDNAHNVATVVQCFESLLESWTTALKSPVVGVKVCASRMLSNIIQEVFFGEKSHASVRRGLVGVISRLIPLDRIERLVLLRMEQEKGAQPICSEYLQCIIELAIAVRVCTDSTDDDGLLPDSRLAPFPESQAEADDTSPDFNWDAMCGNMLSDDGWEVWTGSVRQLESSFKVAPSPAAVFKMSNGREGKEGPPALLPGCKVARPLPKLRKRAKSETERSESGSSSGDSRRASRGLMQLLSERLGGDSSDVNYDIGTVVDICEWPGCSEGSARTIEWADGETEVVKWGAFGEFDVAHVVVDSKNRVQFQHPYPVSKEASAAKAGFATDVSFGVILRLRSLPTRPDDDVDIQGRFDGLMEWPDFKATVYVTGIMYSDGQWTLFEEYVVDGSKDADWTARFGQAEWRPGTTYDLALPRFSESEEVLNSMGQYLLGQFHYPISRFSGQVVHITGDIRIQQTRLFTFDKSYCASSVSVSHDGLAASCGGGEGKCCVYGSVGFSTGVHYWEYKIERCDLGNIFIGVAEKSPHGTPLRLNRWPGYGFVNLRASHRSTDSGQADMVYGDIFQTGDTVGVLLDMNRGRLSFFLDAIKYGEHLMTDLGEAFDCLTAGGSLRVQRRTFFPVVGFRRAGDRIALTPRWISSTGNQTPYNTFRNVSRAWNLLSSWSEERPSTKPQNKDMWTYREAWRDWIRWKANRFMKVRARCRAFNLMIGLDISPRACVDASIRLGLSEALFHGDRIVFTKSCGRPLETKEEAVILGAYKGQLWYRFDSQSGEGALVESSGLAWCLAPDDPENMEVVRRGPVLGLLPAELVETPLARLPAFKGGLLRVSYSEGAVVREGLEIDSSEAISNLESGALVWALQRRVSSSNIARYLVYHQGAETFGWISERIRGGSEEYMVRHETSEPADVVERYKQEVVKALEGANLNYKVHWNDVKTPVEAMRVWEGDVHNCGCGHLLARGQILAESCQSGDMESFEDFLAISTTMDGVHNWTVECDMLLTDFLSRVSSKFGQSPFNISCHQVIDSMEQLDAESPLRKISSERIVARASVIRCANVILGYALPYIEVTLPEAKWRKGVVGSPSNVISVVETGLGTSPFNGGEVETSLKRTEKEMRFQGDNFSQLALEHQFSWQPPCGARRLRSKRRVLFTQTKGALWESILEATTTVTPLHQDEYEDPREIKLININRIKATQARLGAISNQGERIKQAVFGQLHREMRLWPGSSFRRSYLGKGHGGQRRAFKVNFMGEGVNVSK